MGLVTRGVDTGTAGLSFSTGVEDATGLMGNGESRSLAGIAVTVVVVRVLDDCIPEG